ncbi:dGTP triphosphohydrolase [Aliiroseovarius crassostreae]|uniref:dGTP triphosphohydrolase n=1 Tax=Aliiroseovarius crassostreae TaxID=154981 RepID=UPI0021AF21BB|nr:dNTP triphosphohydrolase [Aliiroseovarius crassostreae]
MAEKMQWDRLLNTQPWEDKGKAEDPARPQYVIDADRITFSAPFRRLANKTQVHPLHDNDHLRHRMIHSQEVASVGRTLGTQIGHWLVSEGHLQPGEEHKLAGIVHAACLAHDIGNPPFGHSGENSIGAWCRENLKAGQGVFNGIGEAKWEEFCKFEGNAQGFRILTRLEMYRNEGGMNLSHAALGAFMKYPMGAETSRKIKGGAEKSGIPKVRVKDHIYVGAKKFGFFESEREIFAKSAQALGLIEETGPDGQSWWRRHPLVYLVEAADDICYNIVDLEDGFTAGDLSFDQVATLLDPVAFKTNRDQSTYTPYEKISYLRARAIGGAILACAEAFKANHEAILSGGYSGSLIASSKKAKEFAAIEDMANEQLFTAPRKTKLEVYGRNVVREVLQGIRPVFDALKEQDWNEAKLPEYERQLVRAIHLDLRDIHDSYSALHAMTDYVSGMTDRYAVEVSKMLSGT